MPDYIVIVDGKLLLNGDGQLVYSTSNPPSEGCCCGGPIACTTCRDYVDLTIPTLGTSSSATDCCPSIVGATYRAIYTGETTSGSLQSCYYELEIDPPSGSAGCFIELIRVIITVDINTCELWVLVQLFGQYTYYVDGTPFVFPDNELRSWQGGFGSDWIQPLSIPRQGGSCDADTGNASISLGPPI